jgi:hypothetical protein
VNSASVAPAHTAEPDHALDEFEREAHAPTQPPWPEWAGAAADEPAAIESGRRPSFLVPLLLAIVVAEAGVLGWLLLDSRRASAAPLASVAITSDPAGATVVVDGVERGQTPFTVEDLRPGVSAIVVKQVPAPPVGTAGVEGGALEITTEPTGLAVSVDGQRRGLSPISVIGLTPGTHEIAVARGSSVIRRSVSVEAGVPTAVLISTAGASGIASGWLTVTSPVPVQVLENGTLLGSSDTPRLLLPVGRHELDFVSEAFLYRARRSVQVTAGQAAAVALEPVSGSLSVNALPWAEVWIDGKSVGETPIGNLSLPIGNHELVVRHPELGEQRRTIAVGASGPTRVGIDLRRR